MDFAGVVEVPISAGFVDNSGISRIAIESQDSRSVQSYIILNDQVSKATGAGQVNVAIVVDHSTG